MVEIARQYLTCKFINRAKRLCQNELYGFCPHKETYRSFLEMIIMESDCPLDPARAKSLILNNTIRQI